MSRLHNRLPITLATDDTSPKFNWSDYAGGRVYIPSGATMTTLTFYDAPSYDGTYLATYNEDNEAETMTVAAGRSYPLPAKLFAAGGLQIRANAAEAVIVSLKD